jgi:hypothetical protein
MKRKCKTENATSMPALPISTNVLASNTSRCSSSPSSHPAQHSTARPHLRPCPVGQPQRPVHRANAHGRCSAAARAARWLSCSRSRKRVRTSRFSNADTSSVMSMALGSWTGLLLPRWDAVERKVRLRVEDADKVFAVDAVNDEPRHFALERSQVGS